MVKMTARTRRFSSTAVSPAIAHDNYIVAAYTVPAVSVEEASTSGTLQ